MLLQLTRAREELRQRRQTGAEFWHGEALLEESEQLDVRLEKADANINVRPG